MTDEEFDQKITAAGYKEFPWPRTKWSEGRAYSKRLGPGSPQCLTNEHKTAFHLYRYDPVNFPGQAPDSPHPCMVEIEIVGKYREDRWCDLKVYAMSDDEFMADRERVEDDLRKAWAALHPPEGEADDS